MDHMLILSIIGGAGPWMSLMLLVCNYGDNVSSAFEQLHLTIYSTSWHLCPVKQQKLTILMLAASQNSVDVRGFASITCSRAMYKEVICFIIYWARFSVSIWVIQLYSHISIFWHCSETTAYQQRILVFHDTASIQLMMLLRNKRTDFIISCIYPP